MKECSKCHIRKELTEFSKDRSNKNGYSYKCKQCERLRHKEYSNKHKKQRRDHYKERWGKSYQEGIESVVYILRGVNLYKIGNTNNFPNRWKAYVTHLEVEPQLIHLIQTPDRFKLESQLHTLYQSKRIRGEWFALSEEDIEYIRTL